MVSAALQAAQLIATAYCLLFMLYVRCFDTVGWASVRHPACNGSCTIDPQRFNLGDRVETIEK